jgi:hypothetical protein
VKQLAGELRDLGVDSANDDTDTRFYGAMDSLRELDESDHGDLRFAPDWRSIELSPFGALAAPTASTLLPGWSRPVRVGVMISHESTMVQAVDGKYVGTKWQVHSTAYLPPSGLQLVGVVEPGTVHRGVVECTLRDYRILDGLIEADDETALSSLDVLLLGLNVWMSAPIARAILGAVRGGVGLLNEFWTAGSYYREDPAGVAALMLADGDVYKYHMPPGQCGVAFTPATVLREHALLPGLKAGAPLMVRGCGPAYKVIPGAQVLIAKDYLVPSQQHGLRDVGPLQMPCYIVGQLGRGRVAVIHAWPHEWLARNLAGGSVEYFTNLLRWLAGARHEIA